jgi:hypothetical protein
LAEPGIKTPQILLGSNVLFSRAGHETNRKAPATFHGVGWNKKLDSA